MSTEIKYIKSFSKGQITIPKVFRDALDIADDFWLKLSLEKGKIVAEPVQTVKDKREYKKKLLKMKGGWISESEYKENRRSMEKRLKTLGL